MHIDCHTCVGRGLACDDCVINVLLSRPAEGVDLDDAEQTAFASLADAGLVPPLRLVPIVRIPPGSGQTSRGIA
ncbi:MAG: hypothetical protein ACTHMS_16840 [Jatrophihabitans sp.]|uniref:hypothetical protein n=1 Tax=Jatrophihabitans sp. TaxID=1932789 RepID=UPI003F7FF0FF